MSDPESLRLVTYEGETVVLSGRSVLFRFAVADVGMRRLAMVALTQAGHAVKTVARVFEVHPNYLSTLHKTAREQGSGGAGEGAGAAGQAERGAAGAGAAVGHRRCGGPGDRASVAGVGFHDQSAGGGWRCPDPRAGAGRTARARAGPHADPELADADAELGLVDPGPLVPEVMGGPPDPVLAASGDVAGGAACGSPRLGEATVDSRYAGAMLLHAFFDRVGAAAVLRPRTGAAAGTTTASGTAAVGSRRFDDVALLTATSMAFALGVGSVEATKHLLGDQVEPLAGLARLPELRTLRPRLGELAEGCDPLRLQTDLARAMINAEAPLLGLYFVDDHFVPYEGAKPVGKGYNTKRRHAQKGLADTVVTDYHGRAVCFVSARPRG